MIIRKVKLIDFRSHENFELICRQNTTTWKNFGNRGDIRDIEGEKFSGGGYGNYATRGGVLSGGIRIRRWTKSSRIL